MRTASVLVNVLTMNILGDFIRMIFSPKEPDGISTVMLVVTVLVLIIILLAKFV
jgi:hypothetical protein